MRTENAVRAQWIRALRSGRYSQGFGALRTAEGEHCVMGVLCDVAGLWDSLDPAQPIEGYPPSDVLVAAGLTADQAEYLGMLNDDGLTTFEQMADRIEDGLFWDDSAGEWKLFPPM